MNTKTMWVIVFTSGLLVTSVLISILYRKHIPAVIELFEGLIRNSLKKNIIEFYTIIFLLQTPLYLFFLPFYTLFSITLAFLMKDFLQTVLVLSITGIVWNLVSFYIFSHFKQDFEAFLDDVVIYKALKRHTEQNQWRNGFLVRILYIPVFFKNLILIMFNVDVVVFNVTYLI